jgi:CDP-diacylglycerol--serine O-phosphatidyltransferase
MCFGLASIALAHGYPYAAAVAVLLSCTCDLLDGRIARWTKTESAFGRQLDSLADVINCGAAPAFLIHYWVLHDTMQGRFDLYLLLVFFYVACAAGRLARFNIETDENHAPDSLTQRDDPTVRKKARSPLARPAFSGMPSPVAAMLLCTAVMAHEETGIAFIKRAEVMGPYMLVISVLMISRIPFRSFQKFESRLAQYLFFGSISLGFVLLAIGGPGGTILWCLLLFYVLSGAVGRGISVLRADQQ